MRARIIAPAFFIILISVILIPALSFSQDLSYEYLMDQAKLEFNQQDYEPALHFFKLAQLVKPGSPEPARYINLIKRIKEGRIITEEYVRDFEKEITRKKRARITGLKRALKSLEESPEYTPLKTRERTDLKNEIQRLEKEIEDKKAKRRKTIDKTLLLFQKDKKAFIPKPLSDKDKIRHETKEEIIQTIDLTTALEEEFPLNIEIERYNSFLITSTRIKNILAVSPDIISIKKVDNSTLKIKADLIGSTFLHVWDDQRRWTFNINVIRPRIYTEQEKSWEEAEGFDFIYDIDWGTYYKGLRLGTMEKKSLNINHWAGIKGPTPYGDFYTYMQWERLNQKDVVTGYGVSLTKGNFLNFKDFSIYGFDFAKSFSPLSFPGLTLKGVAFESPAFNNLIEYTLIHGREKESYYYYISPGIGFDDKKDSFVSGAKLTLFPEGDNEFSFNYATAYGSDRQEYLKEKVFSLETKHKINDHLTFLTETATDEDRIAATASSIINTQNLDLTLSARNMEKDFVTIIGRPPNRGEIGGMLNLNWKASDKTYLSTNLDVYRERFFPNPGEPDKINFDWDNSLDLRLTSNSTLRNYTNYSYAPGIISPYRSFSTNTYYHRNDSVLGNRYLSSYIGHTFQRSINPLTPTADYKRNSVLGGLRLELFPSLYSYFDYTYSWVTELQSLEKSNPSVFSTGLEYTCSPSESLSSNLRIYYRDEENTTATHSFLSGEDSIEGSINVSFTPTENTEFFLDGRIRNVWAEDPEAEKYIEADIRAGARFTWDSFFKWTPKTIIEGFVFEDQNGNGIKDKDEPGLPGIKIIAGPNETISQDNGYFDTSIRAKGVVVNIDLNTVPSKYVLTTPSSVSLDVSRGGIEKVDFGLSSQAGIYGVIYYDANQNDELDQEDTPISNVRVTLDKENKAFTNSEGIYYFGNVLPGKHTIRLDVNSLPLEYLPKTPIIKEMEVPQGHTYNYHIPLKKK